MRIIMDQSQLIKASHLNCLGPLLKWRILDVDSLREEAEVGQSYDAFCRIIRNLEKKSVIETFRDPSNRKKYVYLSPRGEELLGFKDVPPSISMETLNHDKWVTQIVHSMLQKNWIHDFKLEHELIGKERFKSSSTIVPDAALWGEIEGRAFSMALELEINRKNFPRIVEKLRQYAHGESYDYVLYYFPNKSLMKTYSSVIEEKISDECKNRFMLFWGDELTPIERAMGVALGKEMNLGELFEKRK